MNYQIRQARDEDIRPALELALRTFIKYDAEDYGPVHIERMSLSIEERLANTDIYLPGNRLMFVALDEEKVIGIIETYGSNRISLMFVDGDYQRQGVATKLMSKMVCALKMRGFDEVVLNSSPNGLLFYKNFGFTVCESEKNINTPFKTPMSYTIRNNELA